LIEHCIEEKAAREAAFSLCGCACEQLLFGVIIQSEALKLKR